ncbi:hypothetical protein ES332_D12G004200v1 [Gossypium tomentosum]|uniref:Uncharacterized protein n=1 Tax=Gossypium tomentosum TaxID=34277 RepID=A0A5D2I3Q3_GOSTO|nr:hypothetical protein ES332_D12G004200v1 [Gossypium tomentosum]
MVQSTDTVLTTAKQKTFQWRHFLRHVSSSRLSFSASMIGASSASSFSSQGRAGLNLASHWRNSK